MSSARDKLEIITAVLLGLVSVATAFGAYQASLYAQRASDLASVSQQLRDRNLTEGLTSQLISRDDSAKMLDAIALDSEASFYPERAEELAIQQQILIDSSSPELAAAWQAWVDSGFAEELVPIASADYQLALFAVPQSLQYVSFEADQLVDQATDRATTLTVAAVVFAIALLLLGVTGVVQGTRVAVWLAGAAGVALLGGAVITVLAGA